VQVSSLGALRGHCRLDITDFGIWAKSPVLRKKKVEWDLRSVAVCVSWNPNLCGNSGSLGVTTLHVPQKKTSRQLSKSRFSTLIGTNLHLLFHERVFFLLLSLSSVSSRLPYSFFPSLRCSGEKECNLENPFTPPENSSGDQAAVAEAPRCEDLLPQDATNPADSRSGQSDSPPSCRP
jgi:hypothetical protein